ncbi:MAG: type II toxin-antitoxin system VapC family toxin [Archaeoglobaceae archaeon]
MRLFDASAIVNLTKKGKLKVFLNGATLDLAIYEALNALWKEAKLLKKIDEKTALEFAEVVSKAIGAMDILSIKDFGKDIFEFACRNNLTIYDASYVYIAIKNDLELVTDDNKLGSVASKYVKVFKSAEL